LAQKLDAGVTTLALAWRLTRGDGLVVAVTQHDRDLVSLGTRFVAATGFLVSDQEAVAALGADRTALSSALSIDAITEDDLKLGRWDGAKIEAFWIDWSNPADAIPIWQGEVSGANWQGQMFELDVTGPQARLNRDIGAVYARTCAASLGDTRCKVDMNAQGRTLVLPLLAPDATNSAAGRSLYVGAPAGSSITDFQGGRIELRTGVAKGWRSDVRAISALTRNGAAQWRLDLARPLPVLPATGDVIALMMGCDKHFATCRTRFANGLNFRGQPTLPGDDVAFGGPALAGNDGGRR
jgi:uncharacterized phage protein (TIGR02218 family)